MLERLTRCGVDLILGSRAAVLFDEVRHRSVQRISDLLHCAERQVLFAMFGPAQVRAVDPGGVGQLLLAPTIEK